MEEKETTLFWRTNRKSRKSFSSLRELVGISRVLVEKKERNDEGRNRETANSILSGGDPRGAKVSGFFFWRMDLFRWSLVFLGLSVFLQFREYGVSN